MTRSPYFLESVDRVMRVLESFTPDSPELRLTDISRRVNMPKPQVLRIVTTLETRGFVSRDPTTKRYRLGIRLFHLGVMVQHHFDVRNVVHPHLDRLVQETQETARLVVPDDNGPICIDVVEGIKRTRVFAQLGTAMPWHAGTSPKLLLAFMPEEQRESILSGIEFARFTAHTTTSAEALREELKAIRQRGYHLGDRDLDEDATGISGPVFDHTGAIVGAINVSWPTTRLYEADVDKMIELIVTAARAASEQLGYLPEHERPSLTLPNGPARDA